MKEWEQNLTNFEVTKKNSSQVAAVLDRCRRAVTGHMYRTRLRADTVPLRSLHVRCRSSVPAPENALQMLFHHLAAYVALAKYNES